MSLIKQPPVYQKGDGFEYAGEVSYDMNSNPCPQFVYQWDGTNFTLLRDKCEIIVHAGARFLGIEPTEALIHFALGGETYRGEHKTVHAIFVSSQDLKKYIQIGECLEHKSVLEVSYDNAKKFLSSLDDEPEEHLAESISRQESNYR